MMIPNNELFNDPDEIHAFLVGVAHGFFFWQKHPVLTEKQKSEQHYYEQGKILGVFLWIAFGWLVKVVIL